MPSNILIVNYSNINYVKLYEKVSAVIYDGNSTTFRQVLDARKLHIVNPTSLEGWSINNIVRLNHLGAHHTGTKTKS